MSRACRVLQSGLCEVTQGFRRGFHNGIDIVNKGYTLGYVVAHSAGTVVACRKNCTGFESGGSYGNYVMIRHDNGWCTLYAHLMYNTVIVSNGQRVSKGQTLGYMGNTGTSYGGHLHFEVRQNTTYGSIVDPTNYLSADVVISKPAPTPTPSTGGGQFKIGDKVVINGALYVSSDANTPSSSVSNKTTYITRYVAGAKHPYNTTGDLGWMDASSIRSAGGSITYTVKSGDTLSGIASRYGMSWNELYAKNKFVIGNNPNIIIPGQVLTIK